MPSDSISKKDKRALQPDDLRIGGFEPFSTVDFPDRLAAVIFCQGCPLRCFYCHNPGLLPATAPALLDWSSIEAALAARRGFLDAVVFSGGEPLAQRALPSAMKRVRELGFAIGLHTSGVYPARLAAALPLVDWVGFDVKSAVEGYEDIVGVKGAGQRAFQSLQLLIASGVDYEVRTTVTARAHDAAALTSLAADLVAAGVRRYALQEERRDDRSPAPGNLFEDAVAISTIGRKVERFAVRRAHC